MYIGNILMLVLGGVRQTDRKWRGGRWMRDEEGDSPPHAVDVENE